MTAPADQRTADDIATLRSWIESCGPGGMVFFGGAGVSTESGIPDFRSTGGLYSQKYSYPPETMVSHSFFEAHPQEFFQFYFDRMIAPEAKPNQAHKKLAELEQRGVCRAVVTQNIDGCTRWPAVATCTSCTAACTATTALAASGSSIWKRRCSCTKPPQMACPAAPIATPS